MTNNITDVAADSFDFMVDGSTRGEFILGLKVNCAQGDAYVIPMTLDTAHSVGSVLLGHVAALRATRKVTTNG